MYQWQVNGSDIEGETLPILILSAVQASTGGSYTCVASNAAGSDSYSTFVYIFPYFITQPIDRLTTNGSSTSLICEAEAFPSPEYQWGHVDETPIRTEIMTNENTLVFHPVMIGDEGDYYCNVSSLGETIRSEEATVTSKMQRS